MQGAFAEDGNGNPEATSDDFFTPDLSASEQDLLSRLNGDKEIPHIVGEDVSLREQNSKTLRRDDGTYSVIVYDTPIHYRDLDGVFIDYDNRLVYTDKGLEPISSPFDFVLPADLANGSEGVRLSDNGRYEISWVYDIIADRTEGPKSDGKDNAYDSGADEDNEADESDYPDADNPGADEDDETNDPGTADDPDTGGLKEDDPGETYGPGSEDLSDTSPTASITPTKKTKETPALEGDDRFTVLTNLTDRTVTNFVCET